MMRDTHKAAEAELAGGRLFIAALPTPDVVSVEGSVFGGPNHVARAKEALPILAAGLLDAGTTKKRKDAFRGALSDRAAELSFFADGDRTYFSGRCFPEDLPFLLHAASEILTLAAFPEAEVRAAKARAAGNIREERSDTRAAAERALLNLLYDDAHVNHPGSLDAFERSVRSVRRPELLAFRKMLGTGGLVLSITGDLVPEEARAAADAAFKRLKRGTEAGVPKIRNRKMPNADVKLIPMRDKANVDVFLGATLGITTADPLFHPSFVLAEMLGGSVTSHLMQTIRERDGLSYGVYARLGGFEDGADGCLKVWATFSPERYEESLAKLRAEVREFFVNGLTEEALARKHEELAGSYLVSLSTSRGLARALHRIGTEGRELDYLYALPDIIRAVSLADIRQAADLVPLSRLSLAASGTFPKK